MLYIYFKQSNLFSQVNISEPTLVFINMKIKGFWSFYLIKKKAFLNFSVYLIKIAVKRLKIKFRPFLFYSDHKSTI